MLVSEMLSLIKEALKRIRFGFNFMIKFIVIDLNLFFLDFENSSLVFPDPGKPVKIALAGFTENNCNNAIKPCKSVSNLLFLSCFNNIHQIRVKE